MNSYLGVKLIKAEPMDEKTFRVEHPRVEPLKTTPREGYRVIYPQPNGKSYTSWSPKDVFEKSYMALEKDNKILEKDVLNFFPYFQTKKIGDRTTFVHGESKTGFVYSETSTCVSEENYDETLGANICMDRIKNKIWEHLGFVLRWAKFGLSKK